MPSIEEQVVNLVSVKWEREKEYPSGTVTVDAPLVTNFKTFSMTGFLCEIRQEYTEGSSSVYFWYPYDDFIGTVKSAFKIGYPMFFRTY